MTSQALSPSDHARMLTDLLKPAGLELGRRWLSALLLVPPEQRQALVEEVERRIAKNYGDRTPEPTDPSE